MTINVGEVLRSIPLRMPLAVIIHQPHKQAHSHVQELGGTFRSFLLRQRFVIVIDVKDGQRTPALSRTDDIRWISANPQL